MRLREDVAWQWLIYTSSHLVVTETMTSDIGGQVINTLLRTTHGEYDAALSAVRVASFAALLVLRRSAMVALDLGEAATTLVIVNSMTPLTATEAVEATTPGPILVLASDLDVVDNVLESAAAGCLERGREDHLHGANERLSTESVYVSHVFRQAKTYHGSVVARSVSIAVLKANLAHEVGETDHVTTARHDSALL
jgi:hypothetical protein